MSKLELRTYDEFKPPREAITIAADCVRKRDRLSVEAGNCIKRLNDELQETRKLLESYGKTGLERLGKDAELAELRRDAARLDAIEANHSWEISHYVGSHSGEAWIVYKRDCGNIGYGKTIREAIDDAIARDGAKGGDGG